MRDSVFLLTPWKKDWGWLAAAQDLQRWIPGFLVNSHQASEGNWKSDEISSPGKALQVHFGRALSLP